MALWWWIRVFLTVFGRDQLQHWQLTPLAYQHPFQGIDRTKSPTLTSRYPFKKSRPWYENSFCIDRTTSVTFPTDVRLRGAAGAFSSPQYLPLGLRLLLAPQPSDVEICMCISPRLRGPKGPQCATNAPSFRGALNTKSSAHSNTFVPNCFFYN